MNNNMPYISVYSTYSIYFHNIYYKSYLIFMVSPPQSMLGLYGLLIKKLNV